jgi:AcrR family transcriptional regulator
MVSERAIIDATMALLNQTGYVGLTLAKVAQRAKVSKATIYRRWPTKEHLVVAAVSHFPELVPHQKGNLVEELLDLQRQHMRHMHTPPLHGLLPQLTAERAHNPALAAALDPYLDQRRNPTRQVFRWAIARGELPADTDIETAVDLVVGVGYLRLYFGSPRSGDLSRESMREVYQLLLRGLQGGRGTELRGRAAPRVRRIAVSPDPTR